MFLLFNRIIQFNEDDSVILPDARFLMEYDKEKKSDLAQTAYCYLLHNREAVATADALYIHRNTLDKRLRKMESLDVDRAVAELLRRKIYTSQPQTNQDTGRAGTELLKKKIYA